MCRNYIKPLYFLGVLGVFLMGENTYSRHIRDDECPRCLCYWIDQISQDGMCSQVGDVGSQDACDNACYDSSNPSKYGYCGSQYWWDDCPDYDVKIPKKYHKKKPL